MMAMRMHTLLLSLVLLALAAFRAPAQSLPLFNFRAGSAVEAIIWNGQPALLMVEPLRTQYERPINFEMLNPRNTVHEVKLHVAALGALDMRVCAIGETVHLVSDDRTGFVLFYLASIPPTGMLIRTQVGPQLGAGTAWFKNNLAMDTSTSWVLNYDGSGFQPYPKCGRYTAPQMAAAVFTVSLVK